MKNMPSRLYLLSRFPFLLHIFYRDLTKIRYSRKREKIGGSNHLSVCIMSAGSFRIPLDSRTPLFLISGRLNCSMSKYRTSKYSRVSLNGYILAISVQNKSHAIFNLCATPPVEILEFQAFKFAVMEFRNHFELFD